MRSTSKLRRVGWRGEIKMRSDKEGGKDNKSCPQLKKKKNYFYCPEDACGGFDVHVDVFAKQE